MPTTAYRATLDAYDGSPARSWCSGRNGWRDGIVEKARSQGLLMDAIVHAADVQDRDGGALLMASLFGAFPFLIKLYADGGYQGREFQSAMQRILARVNVEIVKRSGQAAGFVALPKRWIVERTFAWLGRCRRLAKDWECLNHKALAFLRLASIRLMSRKLCNPI
jgi:transposase